MTKSEMNKSKLIVGSLYKIKGTNTTKKGYEGQVVRLIQGSDKESCIGGVYLVETQNDFKTNQYNKEVTVKKGTILHIFTSSSLEPIN